MATLTTNRAHSATQHLCSRCICPVMWTIDLEPIVLDNASPDNHRRIWAGTDKQTTGIEYVGKRPSLARAGRGNIEQS